MAPDIVGIVIGSTVKGIVAGAIIGYIATRVQSQQALLIAGLAVGAFFAFLIAVIPQPDGTHYWWQIMLPGSVLGLDLSDTRRSGTGKHGPGRVLMCSRSLRS